MEVIYSTEKVKKQCNSVKEAKKLFGGDAAMTNSLLSRINALKVAETLQDIIIQKNFRFHNLVHKNKKNLKGYFAIDVKTRKEKWRIILQPLDQDKNIYDPCVIDRISREVTIVEIREVSNHYE